MSAGVASRNDLRATSWVLSSVAGQRPVGGTSPTLSFGDEYRIFGNGGCNQFYGVYGSENGMAAIRDLNATQKTCEPTIMSQEQAYFDVLRNAESLVVSNDGRLIIVVGPAGRQLTFARPGSAAGT
jgi:heat shock protein HslJ